MRNKRKYQKYKKNRRNLIVLDIMAGLSIFVVGFLSSVLLMTLLYGSFPFSDVLNDVISGDESPEDYVKYSDILVFPDRVVIKIEGASVGRYAPTGSMKPVLDSGTNGIRIEPKSENDIVVGDIITFREDGKLIIHRVVEIGRDDLGIFFITKGDNNSVVDGKIRFSDIEYKTIGLIY